MNAKRQQELKDKRRSLAGQPAGPVAVDDCRDLAVKLGSLQKDMEALVVSFEAEGIKEIPKAMGWTKGFRGEALIVAFVNSVEQAILKVRQEKRARL